MPAIFEILKDKDFQALSYSDKKGVLSHFDPSFSGMDSGEQDKVMAHFNLNQPEVSPDEVMPVQKAASDIYTPALVTLGGIGGAAAGTVAGALTGPGAAATVAAGSALGMAGGIAASNALDRMTGLKPPIQNMSEALSETQSDITTGGAYEAGGAVLNKATQKLVGPMVSKFGDVERWAVQKAKDMGIDLSPAEVVRSKTLAIFENLLSNLPIAGDFADKFRLGQAKQLIKQRNALLQAHGSPETIEQLGERIQEAADNLIREHTKLNTQNALMFKNRLLRKLGSMQSYEEVGMAGQEALKAASEKRYAESQRLYDAVDEFMNTGEKHLPEAYQAKAVKLLADQERASPSLQNTEVLSVLRDISGKDKLEKLLESVPPEMHEAVLKQLPKEALTAKTWAEMSADRTRLGKLIAENDPAYGFSGGAKGTKLVSNEAAGVYKQLFGALDEDMTKVVEAAGPEAKEALQAARSYYGESKQLFNTPLMTRMAKANPETLVDMIFKPGATTPIRMARKAMGNEAFNGLASKFTNRLLDTPEGIPLTSELLNSRIKKYGVDTLEEIYGHDAADIINLPKQLETVEGDLANNSFFKGILRRDPQKIVDYLVQPNNTANAKKLVDGLGVKMKEKVGEGLVTNILQYKAENSHGEFSPNFLDSAINRYGEQTLKEWLPPQALKDLQDFSQVAMRAPKAAAMGHNPSGTARMVLGGASGVYFMYNPKKALKIAVPAAVLARLYFTPVGRQYLAEGFGTALRSPEAQKVFNRLATSAINLIHEEFKEE